MTKQVVTIKRNPATTQNFPDQGIEAVEQQIKSLFPGTVTAPQVAAALSPHHQGVAISPALTWYEYVQDPITGYWERICHNEAAVVVTDSPLERPIEVAIDDVMSV